MQQCLSCLVETDYKSDFPMDIAPLSIASYPPRLFYFTPLEVEIFRKKLFFFFFSRLVKFVIVKLLCLYMVVPEESIAYLGERRTTI